jgi:hypothetical protein
MYAAWALEWCTVVARWSRDDFDKLQPVVSGPVAFLSGCLSLMLAVVLAEEQALQPRGTSETSNSASVAKQSSASDNDDTQ